MISVDNGTLAPIMGVSREQKVSSGGAVEGLESDSHLMLPQSLSD